MIWRHLAEAQRTKAGRITVGVTITAMLSQLKLTNKAMLSKSKLVGPMWLPRVLDKLYVGGALVSAMNGRSSELGLSNLHLRISVWYSSIWIVLDHSFVCKEILDKQVSSKTKDKREPTISLGPGQSLGLWFCSAFDEVWKYSRKRNNNLLVNLRSLNMVPLRSSGVEKMIVFFKSRIIIVTLVTS